MKIKTINFLKEVELLKQLKSSLSFNTPFFAFSTQESTCKSYIFGYLGDGTHRTPLKESVIDFRDKK